MRVKMGLAVKLVVVAVCVAMASLGANAAVGVFEKVSEAAAFKAGDKILIVSTKNSMAMGPQLEKYRAAVPIVISNNKISNPVGAQVITLEQADDFEYPFFLKATDADGKAGYLNIGNSYARTGELAGDKSYFLIYKIWSSYENLGLIARNHYKLLYTVEKGVNCFAGRVSEGERDESTIDFYRLIPGTDVVGAPTISSDYNQVTITAEGASAIYYTTDGTAPTPDNGQQYSAPIDIKNLPTGAITIKAVAVGEDNKLTDISEYTAVNVSAPTATWYAANQSQAVNQIETPKPFILTGIANGVYISITAPEGHALWYSLTGQSDGQTANDAANAAKSVAAKDIALTRVDEGKATDILVQYSGKLEYYSEDPTTEKHSHIITVTFTGTTGCADLITPDDADTATPVELYNLQGQRITTATPPSGPYIRRQGSQATKILIH